MRRGLAGCKSIAYLDLGRTQFNAPQMVVILGGLTSNRYYTTPALPQCVLPEYYHFYIFFDQFMSFFVPIFVVLKLLIKTIIYRNIIELNFQDVYFDEPSCLQLAHAINTVLTLRKLNLRNAKMGERGSGMIVSRLETASDRFTHIDLTGNKMGPKGGVILSRCLSLPTCTISNLYLGDNDLMETGGTFLAKAMMFNTSLREVDLSHNLFTPEVADYLGSTARGWESWRTRV